MCKIKDLLNAFLVMLCWYFSVFLVMFGCNDFVVKVLVLLVAVQDGGSVQGGVVRSGPRGDL